MRKKVLSVILVMVLVAVSIFTYFQTNNTTSIAAFARNGYELIPTKQDSTGIFVDTAFKLKSGNQELTLDEIESGLVINDGLSFQVKEESNNTFLITMDQPLDKNSIYRFTFTNTLGMKTTWAFQSVHDFEVLGTLPGNQSSHVPLNSGIEMYFSHDNIDDFKNHFDISPNVKGNFEYNGRTVIFVPKETLEPTTLYTVTLKKGLTLKDSEQALQEDYVFQFETDTESYDEGNNYYFSFFRSMFEFAPGEDIRMPLNYYIDQEDDDAISIETKIFAYNDYDSFIEHLSEEIDKPVWSYYNLADYLPETKDLTKVMDFEYELPTSYNHRNPVQLELPEHLEQGAYVVLCSYEDVSFYTYLQITDLSVFTSATDNGVLFWVNSIENKAPVKDATIILNEGTAVTNSNGTAFLEPLVTDNDAWINYAKVTTGEKHSVLPIMATDSYNYRNNKVAEYWSYMHLDRNLYKPSDAISFFGFAKSRYDAKTIDTLTIEITEGYYWYPMMDMNYFYPFAQEPLVSQTIQATGNYYEGNLELPALAEGSYNLVVKSGEQVISSQYFSVENYMKPAYKLSLSKDKNALFVGETINYTAAATFFEGTGLPDLPVNYDIWGNRSNNGRIITNSNGIINFSFTPKYNIERQGNYQGSANVYASLPETGEIYTQDNFRIFNNNIHVNSVGKVEDDKATLTLDIHEVDLTRLNNNTAKDYNDFLGKVIEGRTISGSLYKNYYIKEEIGEYYDYINKVVRKNYNYKPMKDKIENFEAITNQEGKISVDFELGDTNECYYTVEFSTYDNNNKKMSFTTWFSEPYYPYGNESPRLEFNKDNFDVNEQVEVEMINVEETSASDQYMFILAQNGIIDFNLTDSSKYNFSFDSSYIPNINVVGVYFNGSTYIYTYEETARYDYEHSKLTIEAKPDKEEYKPGELCNIELYVVDEDGQPVSGMVNAAIVDEALFALSDMNYYVLEQLYQNIDSGINYMHATHRSDEQYSPLYGRTGMNFTCEDTVECEKSEESLMDGGNTSSNEVRDEFLDVASFKTIPLDAQGKGTLSFELPDNITSWRISLVGLTNDLEAGSDVTNINVTLPFFINASLNTNYLSGDLPYIGITAYGNLLKSKDVVEYEVTSPQFPDYKETYSSEAFKRINIPLFKVNEGAYDVIVSAQSGSFSDSVKYSFNVTDTYKTIQQSIYTEAKPNVAIPSGESGLTKIVFTNEGSGQYLPSLYRLSYFNGNRIDQKLTSKKAINLLETYTKEDLKDNDYNLASYQKDDGGLALLPYADSDVFVTVDNIPIMTDGINISRIKMYLYNVLSEGTTLEQSAALFGLATLGESVLSNVEEMNSLNNLEFKANLYLALAYNALGDSYMAETIYDNNIKSHIESYDKVARVVYSKDYDEDYALTAMSTLLLSKINHEDKDKLFEYIQTNYSSKVLISNYKLAYIENEMSKYTDENVALDYSYDGNNYTAQLTDGYCKTINIPSRIVNELKITKVTGDVGIVSLFEEQITELPDVDSNISVNRTYYDLDGNKKTTFKEGDIVKVIIDYDIDDDSIDRYYEITDFLPSGLKALENHYHFGSRRYYYPDIDGQKIRFHVYRDDEKKEPIEYYARIISLGEYKADETIIQGQIYKDSINYSDSFKLSITE